MADSKNDPKDVEMSEEVSDVFSSVLINRKCMILLYSSSWHVGHLSFKKPKCL